MNKTNKFQIFSIMTLIVLTASVVVGSSYTSTTTSSSFGLIPALAIIEEDTARDLGNVLDDDATEELTEVLEDDSGAREDFFEVLEQFDAADDESVQAVVDFINEEVG
jgi:hypothetical protein